jgi:hypothetical protein
MRCAVNVPEILPNKIGLRRISRQRRLRYPTPRFVAGFHAIVSSTSALICGEHDAGVELECAATNIPLAGRRGFSTASVTPR